MDDALADWDSFHWLILSSTNGVEAVQARLERRGQALAHRPRSLKIAAVGRKTAARLEELGAAADFVPPEFVADSLLENFPVSGWGLRLLLPRVQSGGRTVLAEAFAAAGARVVEVAAYESRCPAGLPTATLAALERGQVDAITFSSGKTVRHTCSMLEQAFGSCWRARLDPLAVVSIGPQTSQVCRNLLGRLDAEASPTISPASWRPARWPSKGQIDSVFALAQAEAAVVDIDRGHDPARREQRSLPSSWAEAPGPDAEGARLTGNLHQRLGGATGAHHPGETEPCRQLGHGLDRGNGPAIGIGGG